MEDISGVIKRIQKLLALSGSKNENEAASAAAKAAQLMRDYELETADLEAAGADSVEDGGLQQEIADTGGPRGSRVRWRQTIGGVLAKINGLKVWCDGAQTVYFGRALKVSATRYVLAYLCNEVASAADRGYRASGFVGRPHQWKTEFSKGSAWRICERLLELHEEQKAAEVVTETALVVLRKRDEQLEAGFKAMGLRLKKISPQRSRATDAFKAGQAHGSSVDLGNAGRPRLGAAPGKLKDGGSR